MTLEKAARIARCSLLPNRPYHVQWMLTRKCNYRCEGCNVWRDQNVEELSTDKIKEGLNVLKELDVMEIVFSGGAPLLRDDVDEILEYASRYFITTVYDNGSLAEKKIDALQNVDFVAISLDTLDPVKNDYAKGIKGAWGKAMKTIETLHENGVSVSISPTISQLNLHEIVDLTKYFTQKEIPVLYCLYSYDGDVDSNQLFKIGKKNDELEIVDREGMVKLCDTLIEMKKQSGYVLITTKTLEAIKRLYGEGKRTWKCRALQNFFMIDHLGRVAGCHLRSPVASIFDLPNVWNSQRLNILRRNYSECAKCTYLCYIFYSLHGSVIGNFQIAQDRWRNASILWKKNKPMLLSSARQR
jgi:MoaA/NifB/PqqE/SkfB family radical SAM enzyme